MMKYLLYSLYLLLIEPSINQHDDRNLLLEKVGRYCSTAMCVRRAEYTYYNYPSCVHNCFLYTSDLRLKIYRIWRNRYIYHFACQKSQKKICVCDPERFWDFYFSKIPVGYPSRIYRYGTRVLVFLVTGN